MRKEPKTLNGVILPNFGDVLDIIDGETIIGFKYDGIGAVMAGIPINATILLNIILFSSKYMLLHSILLIATAFSFLPFSFYLKDYESYHLRRYYAISFPLVISLIWFISGGIYGITGYIWMVETVFYNSSLVTGKKSKFYVGYAAIVNLIMMSITYFCPETLLKVENQKNLDIYNAIMIFIVCFFIWSTVWLQRKIAENVQDRLREANDELVLLNEKVNNQMQTQTHLTSSMNHELRSPLNSIIGNLDVMLMNENMSEADRICVENAYNSSKIMLKTVNDLLDFAKLREGKFEIVPDDFDLHKIIKNTSGNYDIQAKQKGLELKVEVADSTVCGLYGDDVRIEQIINNLMSNAVKYTDKGYVKCSFEVRINSDGTKEEDAVLGIKVQDTGQGMSTSNIDEIAEPFTRFNEKKNKNIQGTGLGMNIVKSLICEMKGEISCKTALGKGTEFTVKIPVKITDPKNIFGLEINNTVTEAKNITADFSEINILYMDDEQMNLNVFKRMLAKTGASITTVQNGRDGIALAKENKYDIIFTDHLMPEIDGIEACKIIKKNGLNQDTPMVMLSGNAGDEYKDVYKSEGIEYFLSKPIMAGKLIDLIKTIMEI